MAILQTVYPVAASRMNSSVSIFSSMLSGVTRGALSAPRSLIICSVVWSSIVPSLGFVCFVFLGLPDLIGHPLDILRIASGVRAAILHNRNRGPRFGVAIMVPHGEVHHVVTPDTSDDSSPWLVIAGAQFRPVPHNTADGWLDHSILLLWLCFYFLSIGAGPTIVDRILRHRDAGLRSKSCHPGQPCMA